MSDLHFKSVTASFRRLNASPPAETSHLLSVLPLIPLSCLPCISDQSTGSSSAVDFSMMHRSSKFRLAQNVRKRNRYPPPTHGHSLASSADCLSVWHTVKVGTPEQPWCLSNVLKSHGSSSKISKIRVTVWCVSHALEDVTGCQREDLSKMWPLFAVASYYTALERS